MLLPGVELEEEGQMSGATSAHTVYVVKAMTAIADHPKGRTQLQGALPDLEVLALSSEPLVQKSALLAIESITWTP